MQLPVVLNLNPRSLYNKIEEFKTYVSEKQVDVICLSESWEREDKPIEDIFDIDEFTVISNPYQRKGRGGRPAIILNNEKYNVDKLDISCPWGVEMVWALLTIKNATAMSKIQRIMVGSFYSKPGSRKKTQLLDHIAEVYHQTCSKFANGLHWIICADSNELKLDSILDLNSGLKQCVDKPTHNDSILDPIITDLHLFYQVPKIEEPLDSDSDKNGAPSDHKMVLMVPLNTVDNRIVRDKKTVEVRAFTEDNFQKMGAMLQEVDWKFIYQNSPISDKMERFQGLLFSLFENSFPLKRKVVLSDNEPFISDALLAMRRKKQREYNKNRKSKKYLDLDRVHKNMLSKSMKAFYRKKVSHLRTCNSKSWYRSLKELMRTGTKDSNPEVESIKHLPDLEQAEAIADSFAKISNEYEPINRSKIQLPVISSDDILQISKKEVLEVLKSLKLNKACPKNDIPAKIYKRFAEHLCGPLTVLFNECIEQGVWADFMKVESVTPVPKVSHPKTVNDLRKISGLLNISKILEKVIVKYLVQDIKVALDRSQYANQEGQSINHYLVFMIDTILKFLDGSAGGQHSAVIMSLIDWSKAFDRQDATLAVKSFQENGVRPCLIPLLISFFEKRLMTVKWHNVGVQHEGASRWIAARSQPGDMVFSESDQR